MGGTFNKIQKLCLPRNVNSDAAKEVRWMTMMIGKFQINILIVLIRYGLYIFMVYMQTAKIQNSLKFLRFWTPET